nr:cytochrome P450 4EC1 [Brachionus rubens]
MEFLSILNTSVFLIFVSLTLKLFKWLYKYYYNFQRMKNIKSLPILPFIGNVHLIKPRNEVYNQLLEIPKLFKNEPFWCNWVGTYPVIIVHNSDVVEEFFNSSKHTEKAWQYNLVHPWLGTGLLTSHGEKWYTRRRLLTPAFHFDILEKFREIFNNHAEGLVQKFEDMYRDKKPVELYKEIRHCTLQVIAETAMGVTLESQINFNSDYVLAVERASKLLNDRFNSPWQWWDPLYHLMPSGKEFKKCLGILHTFTRNVILKRDSEFDDVDFESKNKIAFLDILLKAKRDNPNMTFQDIQEEVDTFMFEGHDTTASGLFWTILLIAEHPHVQEKLQLEIDQFFGQSRRSLTSDDLRNLKYLDCVIKESLRLYPPVPFVGRTISEDCVIGGHRLEKYDPILIGICTIHRDERYFPEPEKFDPDRFASDKVTDKHPYSFIPFSAGRRNCIGQKFAQNELKIVLAYLVRSFKISCETKLKDIIQVGELTLHPVNDVKVLFEPRF